MKKIFHFALSPFQKVLALICCAIVLVTIFVTAVSITSSPEKIGKDLRRLDPEPSRVEKKAGKDAAIYSELGSLRAVTADIPSVPVVISPYFPYPASDTSFFEELSQKKRQIRSIFLEYFAQHTKEQLVSIGEDKIKKDLIARINSVLVLGKIDVLYFNEYIFLN